MKKGSKIGVYVILALLFSISLTSIVSAGFGESGFSLPDGVKKTFSSWQDGALNEGFAKVLVFFLVFLVVYLIIGSIFGQNGPINGSISLGISAVIAFLSTAYIVPEELRTLLLSYSALGMTITALIPFALLWGFTYRTAESRGNLSMVILQNIAWWFFFAFTIYKLISAYNSETQYSGWIALTLLAITTISFLAAMGNNMMMRWLTRRIVHAENTQANRTQAEADAATQRLAQSQQRAAQTYTAGDGI